MGTAGPPGAELPAERRLYCICLFAADSSPCCVRTPAVASRCVCSPAAHSDKHHPVIKMPAGLNKERVCWERFGIPVKPFFSSPSNPRDPERKLENDWSQILPVKGWKTVRKTGVTSHCGDYNDEGFLQPRLTVCGVDRVFWAALESSKLVILDIYSDNYKMLMQLEVVKTGFSFKRDGNSSNQEEFL